MDKLMEVKVKSKIEASKASQTCYHCGDDCKTINIRVNDKYFCCEGCKTVYEIIHENNLCNYYNLENHPGAKQNKAMDEYLFLDNEEIKSKLINFEEGFTCKVTFYIPNIHCSSCLWLLENLHRINKGIIKSEINFPKKQASILFNKESIQLKELASLLNHLGYPPLINLSQVSKKKIKTDPSLYIKLGVAGFCFANIMLLSFPDYLGFQGLQSSLGNFFGYLSLLLGTPVAFYCASDYFTSSITAIRNRMINIDLPIALSLMVIYGKSCYEILTHTGMGYLDSFSGLIFFLLIGKWYQRKTFEAISFERDYQSYFPVAVTKIENTHEVNVPIYKLQKGDRIRIRHNDLIPADGKIVSGMGEIDYSFVTGESVSVEKKQGEHVFAGGRQKGKLIEIEIQKEINQSYFTQLWNQDVFQKEKNLSLSNFANLIGKYFTIAILLVGIGTFAFWQLVDPSKAVLASVSVLIIFCPCTLALAIPFCFSNTLKILGKKGFYLKNSDTVEVIGNINTIVFDKTGTITSSEQKAKFLGRKLSKDDRQAIKALVKNSSHPLSRIIYQIILEEASPSVQSFSEEQGKGIIGVVNGKAYKIGSCEFVVGREENDKTYETKTYVQIEKEVVGFYCIQNNIRPGLYDAISKLSQTYELHMISGDQSSDKSKMERIFPNKNNIHFGLDPIQKLEYIKELQSQGKKVMMVGDGLNDAGALKQSDAGVAVSDDIYNFSPSCDAIVNSNQLHLLNKFLSYCKSSSTIVKFSLLISLSYNITGLVFATSAHLSPMIAAILMPASSVSVVLFVIGMSNLFAKRNSLI
jgi:Cu+-exporting ATPase